MKSIASVVATFLLCAASCLAQAVHTPKFIMEFVGVDPIIDNSEPSYRMRNFAVEVPGLLRADSALVCEIKAVVFTSMVRDLKTHDLYQVIVTREITPRQASDAWRIQNAVNGVVS